MIIQKFVIKQGEYSQLYYRSHGDVRILQDGMYFGQGGSMSTDTYFNSLSIEKWYRYCDIPDILLNFVFSGDFNIKVMHACFKEDRLCSEIIIEKELRSQSATHYQYVLPKVKEGVVFYVLESKGAESVLYNAYYECVPVKTRDVTIALNICTYKREKYLKRNLELLHKEILGNESSPVYGHLKVFITDNGQTLNTEELTDENTKVFPNPNLGGAGGFTRGLVEIAARKETDRITNVIFMDDDIEIEPEAIHRTYAMLRILKPEYKDTFIAGAMLRLDRKNIQHENGAVWDAGRCHFVNRGLDLFEFTNVVKNELDMERDYSGWWYCCVPVHIVRNDNLPIPVFIHEDDVEYSLRNANQVITMNGIAVWHEAVDNKRPSVNEYYDLRNMLIVNAQYCENFSAKQLKKILRDRLLNALIRYRYKDMHLIYQALEDFCKGADWLLELDAVSYHKELQSQGHSFISMSCDKIEKEIQPLRVKDVFNKGVSGKVRWNTIKKLITLNGWLLPARKGRKYFYMSVHPMSLYRVKEAVLYDDRSRQGIVVRKEFSQIFVMIKLYLKVCRLVDKKYEMGKESYRNRYRELRSIEYWGKLFWTQNG